MHHQAHSRRVDTHAEGGGRHHDIEILREEPAQHLAPALPGEAGVIGARCGGRRTRGAWASASALFRVGT